MKTRLALGSLVLALGLAGAPAPVAAFCGFYVAGADASLYNDATVVVLMREGTRTVLSMQNDYQGPIEDFALVVPVPVVLREGDVKTLPKSLFERVDQLAAPRLVEYWEANPCTYEEPPRFSHRREDYQGPGPTPERGVTVESEFVVGEYQIQVLSAEDATGLDLWLREHDYSIPANAEPLLRPYVQSDMKFFVAKVDVDKVQFEQGRALLSPLRFHYDSPEFSLPVRLGLINARGPQDLLIHILATERYEVANRENVAIPTNLVVRERTRDAFGKFYVALFDETLANHPGAVVTEYAWDVGSCDPCPTQPLDFAQLLTLGLDVMPDLAAKLAPRHEGIHPSGRKPLSGNFVLTRLHARYDSQSLGDDLVFATAPGLFGGGGEPDTEGRLRPGSSTADFNMFQARYAILHRFNEPTYCFDPKPGHWNAWNRSGRDSTRAATHLAFESRDAIVADFLGSDPPPERTPHGPEEHSCHCSSEPDAGGPTLFGLALLGLAALRRRRNHA